MAFSILVMCNPLLDIIIQGTKEEIESLGLELGSATVRDDESTLKLIHSIMNGEKNVNFVAGGSLLNSLRVCQGFFKNDDDIELHFTGSIGDDSRGILMQELLVELGIKSEFNICKNFKLETAVCAAFITNKERTLLASLGAAREYSMATFLRPSLQKVLHNVSIVAASGYFVEVCFDAVIEAAKVCNKNSSTFIFNLSAVYITQKYIKQLILLLPYVDYLIGNAKEFVSLCEILKCNSRSGFRIVKSGRYDDCSNLTTFGGNCTTVEDNHEDSKFTNKKLVLKNTINITKKEEMLGNKINETPSTVMEDLLLEIFEHVKVACKIICTRGKYPLMLVQRENENTQQISGIIDYYNCIHVPEEKQVDFNGCGDGFQGGLMYGLAKSYPLHDCIYLGIYAASIILQNIGCSFDSIETPKEQELVGVLKEFKAANTKRDLIKEI
ncbi:putative adenosine kinase [Cryptosporidium serpentis]